MKKQIFVVGAALLSWSLVGGMHHGLFLSAQEAFRKRLGVSQSQDRNEMISKRNVNNDILLSPKHIQGYIQYEYWKGSNCNDTKTNIHGFQLDHCVLHLSGNGSYEIQISDADCTTVWVTHYSDKYCSQYLGDYVVPDEHICSSHMPDSFMSSGKLKCVSGTQPEIDIISTITSSTDVHCQERPIEFSATTNSVCLDVTGTSLLLDDISGEEPEQRNEWLTCNAMEDTAHTYTFLNSDTCTNTSAYPATSTTSMPVNVCSALTTYHEYVDDSPSEPPAPAQVLEKHQNRKLRHGPVKQAIINYFPANTATALKTPLSSDENTVFTMVTCSVIKDQTTSLSEPLLIPTPYPTFGVPSAAPSIQGVTPQPTVRNQVVFSVEQIVYGISYATYQANSSVCDQALKAAIAVTMDGVTPDNIVSLVVSQRPIDGSRGSISSSYTVSVNLAGASYSSLSTQLSGAVTSGQFSQYLGGYAEQYGAVGLVGASSVWILSKDDTQSSSESDGSGSGRLSGDAVGGIVGAALLVVLVYVIYTRLYPSCAADSADVAESPMVEMVPTPSLQRLEESQQTVMHNRQW